VRISRSTRASQEQSAANNDCAQGGLR
jgi:hypothetical protein